MNYKVVNLTLAVVACVQFTCASTQTKKSKTTSSAKTPSASNTETKQPSQGEDTSHGPAQYRWEKCTVTDGGVPSGSVTFQVPVFGDFHFLTKDDACGQYQGDDPEKPRVFVNVFAVTPRDRGPEQLLNQKPNGVLMWLLDLTGPDATPISDGNIEIDGEVVVYHRVLGLAPDSDRRYEFVTTVLNRPTHNIVIVAGYPPNEAQVHLNKILDLISRIQIQETRSGQQSDVTITKF